MTQSGITRRGLRSVPQRAKPQEAGQFGQILPFPRRPGQPLVSIPAARSDETLVEPADQFAEYEQEQDEVVDYRQRMLMNVIALAIVTFLIAAGVWIADTITEMQRDQDCMMQGRSNCLPLESTILKIE